MQVNRPRRKFSRAAVTTGTFIIVALFLDEVRRRLLDFGAHLIYVNAVLKCGIGLSMLLLSLLSVSQIISCAVLCVPLLYSKLGTVIPSIMLGTTALLELFLYRGFRDWEIVCKVIITEACVTMVAIMRRDAEARLEAMGGKLMNDLSLSLEAVVRKAATRCRAASFGPPIAGIVFVWAFAAYRFWNDSGTNSEMKRVSFTLCMAECALISFIAGQDRSPRMNIDYDTWLRRLERLNLGLFAVRSKHKLI
jgi:hypothetical protein